MAKLLGLLVAAEGFVPVAGRVYAQGGGGWVNPYDGTPRYARNEWHGESLPAVCGVDSNIWDCGWFALADDHTTAIITAEAILAARGAECQ